jgi:hypothetical protein
MIREESMSIETELAAKVEDIRKYEQCGYRKHRCFTLSQHCKPLCGAAQTRKCVEVARIKGRVAFDRRAK